jgi:imidazolonepropionase-like amidohydrolase
MNTFVLIKAMIIDGTGAAPLPNGSVIIEGERIKEVIPGPPGRVPSDAIIIDCHHQTLMPGLIDAHVHVGAVEANLIEQQRRSFYSLLIIRTLKVIKEALDQGFTTVRDAGGVDSRTEIIRRRMSPFTDRGTWGFPFAN